MLRAGAKGYIKAEISIYFNETKRVVFSSNLAFVKLSSYVKNIAIRYIFLSDLSYRPLNKMEMIRHIKLLVMFSIIISIAKFVKCDGLVEVFQWKQMDFYNRGSGGNSVGGSGVRPAKPNSSGSRYLQFIRIKIELSNTYY